MTVCIDNCQITEMIATCVKNLEIGTITSFNTDILIYIEDDTTGAKPIAFPSTTDGAGIVELTDIDTFPTFMPNHSYKLWVALESATSVESRETITINAIEYTCFNIRFTRVKQPDNTAQIYTNLTLTPC